MSKNYVSGLSLIDRDIYAWRIEGFAKKRFEEGMDPYKIYDWIDVVSFGLL